MKQDQTSSKNLSEKGGEMVPYSKNEMTAPPRAMINHESENEIIEGSLVQESHLSLFQFASMLGHRDESMTLAETKTSPTTPPAPPQETRDTMLATLPENNSCPGWLLLVILAFIIISYVLGWWSFNLCFPVGNGMQFCF